MIFFNYYILTVNKPYDEVTQIFRDNLDDMSKKGYSLGGNTVIYNSDHKNKLLSGEYKNDGFVVRDADISDMFYTILPKHKISFKKLDSERTEIIVKSKNVVMLCLCMLVFFVFLALSFVLLFASQDMGLKVMLFDLIPLSILIALSVLSAKQISGIKYTLQYMYKS